MAIGSLPRRGFSTVPGLALCLPSRPELTSGSRTRLGPLQFGLDVRHSVEYPVSRKPPRSKRMLSHVVRVLCSLYRSWLMLHNPAAPTLFRVSIYDGERFGVINHLAPFQVTLFPEPMFLLHPVHSRSLSEVKNVEFPTPEIRSRCFVLSCRAPRMVLELAKILLWRLSEPLEQRCRLRRSHPVPNLHVYEFAKIKSGDDGAVLNGDLDHSSRIDVNEKSLFYLCDSGVRFSACSDLDTFFRRLAAW